LVTSHSFGYGSFEDVQENNTSMEAFIKSQTRWFFCNVLVGFASMKTFKLNLIQKEIICPNGNR